jgi:RNA polymerase sigma-70 factor, ECF subfamily
MEGSSRQMLVSQALSGQEQALWCLVDLLTPVIQARVARVLLAYRPPDENYTVRQQVEDLSQDVFLLLFNDDARVLRSWQPEQGLSLENFVGLVARRQALSYLRSGKRNPWREDPTLNGESGEPAVDSDPEERTASREALRLLLRRLQEELSPLGWHLFQLLLVQERSVEEVEQQTGMSPDALYAWRSRLRRVARRLLGEVLSESYERREFLEDAGACVTTISCGVSVRRPAKRRTRSTNGSTHAGTP